MHVPACPEWTVREVVAHLAGVVDDVLAGRMDGVATDPWTTAQVESRSATPLLEILAEWESKAPQFAGFLDAVGPPGRQAVADAVTHEHDIRGALGKPAYRESDAVEIGLAFVAGAFVASAEERQIELLVRVADGPDFGDAGSGLILTGDRFSLLRAMTGRRSEDQLRKMDWQGEPETAIEAFTFGPFRPSKMDVYE